MVFSTSILDRTVFSEELTVKHYKNILKSSYGEHPNKTIFVETIVKILAELTNLEISFFKNLSIVDVFCLLIDIRINSLGSSTEVSFIKDNKKINLELNLLDFKNYIISLKDNLNTIISHEEINVTFECPSFLRLLENANANYISFIKQIKTNNITVDILDNTQAELIFDNLPPIVSMQILKQFNKAVEYISTANYLAKYGITQEQLIFIPSFDSFIWFTKLLFSEDLSTFYENVFCLSHVAHMSADYIENCVVGEYIYFVNCLKKTTKTQENNNENREGYMDNQDDIL